MELYLYSPNINSKMSSLSVKQATEVKVRGKVVPVFLTEHHAMEEYWGVKV
jgi:hypothetical protein